MTKHLVLRPGKEPGKRNRVQKNSEKASDIVPAPTDKSFTRRPSYCPHEMERLLFCKELCHYKKKFLLPLTAWYFDKNRQLKQWNQIKDRDINLYTYEYMVFDTKPNLYKESIFNKWCWHNWIFGCRRTQIDPYLSPCTKQNSSLNG